MVPGSVKLPLLALLQLCEVLPAQGTQKGTQEPPAHRATALGGSIPAKPAPGACRVLPEGQGLLQLLQGAVAEEKAAPAGCSQCPNRDSAPQLVPLAPAHMQVGDGSSLVLAYQSLSHALLGNGPNSQSPDFTQPIHTSAAAQMCWGCSRSLLDIRLERVI